MHKDYTNQQKLKINVIERNALRGRCKWCTAILSVCHIVDHPYTVDIFEESNITLYGEEMWDCDRWILSRLKTYRFQSQLILESLYNITISETDWSFIIYNDFIAKLFGYRKFINSILSYIPKGIIKNILSV